MADTAILRRLDRLCWTITALVAAVVLAACAATSFRVVWATFLVPAATGLALFAGAFVYRRLRPDPMLANALDSTAQVLVFAAVGAPLSYLAAAANLPLLDGLYDRLDRAMGVDWHMLLTLMNRESAWHPLFSLAYQSFTIQATLTVLVLAFTRRFLALKIFTLAFIAAALVCIAVSAVMPAQGVWGYYALSPADHTAIVPVTRELHLPIFNGLRDGSVRELVGMGAEGIITFPSFHAALGVIFILALWPVPVIRWLALAVNLTMIAATPVDGGHYVIDVVAGMAIAVACFAGARAIAARMEAAVAATAPPAARLAHTTPAE